MLLPFKEKPYDLIYFIVKLLNPNTIRFSSRKRNGFTEYSKPLNKVVEARKELEKELEIGMMLRRVQEGSLHTPNKEKSGKATTGICV